MPKKRKPSGDRRPAPVQGESLDSLRRRTEVSTERSRGTSPALTRLVQSAPGERPVQRDRAAQVPGENPGAPQFIEPGSMTVTVPRPPPPSMEALTAILAGPDVMAGGAPLPIQRVPHPAPVGGPVDPSRIAPDVVSSQPLPERGAGGFVQGAVDGATMGLGTPALRRLLMLLDGLR